MVVYRHPLRVRDVIIDLVKSTEPAVRAGEKKLDMFSHKIVADFDQALRPPGREGPFAAVPLGDAATDVAPFHKTPLPSPLIPRDGLLAGDCPLPVSLLGFAPCCCSNDGSTGAPREVNLSFSMSRRARSRMLDVGVRAGIWDAVWARRARSVCTYGVRGAAVDAAAGTAGRARSSETAAVAWFALLVVLAGEGGLVGVAGWMVNFGSIMRFGRSFFWLVGGGGGGSPPERAVQSVGSR